MKRRFPYLRRWKTGCAGFTVVIALSRPASKRVVQYKKKWGNKEYSRQLIVEIIDRENGIRIMNKIISVFFFFFLYSATLSFKWVIQRTDSGYRHFSVFLSLAIGLEVVLLLWTWGRRHVTLWHLVQEDTKISNTTQAQCLQIRTQCWPPPHSWEKQT